MAGKLFRFVFYRLLNYTYSSKNPFGNSPLNSHLKKVIPEPFPNAICHRIKKMIKNTKIFLFVYLFKTPQLTHA